MLTKRPFLWLFIASSLVAGFVYWWQADWWAYVVYHDGRPPMRKFMMPLSWQITESSIVGMIIGGLLVWALRLIIAGYRAVIGGLDRQPERLQQISPGQGPGFEKDLDAKP